MNLSLKYIEDHAWTADTSIGFVHSTTAVDNFGNEMFDKDNLLGEHLTNFANPCDPFFCVLDPADDVVLYDPTDDSQHVGGWLKWSNRGNPPSITVCFSDELRNPVPIYSTALSVEFNPAYNNYPRALYVSFSVPLGGGEFKSVRVLAATQQYIDSGGDLLGVDNIIIIPASTSVVIDVPEDAYLQGYSSVTIMVYYTAIPNTMVKISKVRPWAEIDIPEEDIASNSFVDEISPLSIECPASTLDFKLNKANGIMRDGGKINVITDYTGIHNPILFVTKVTNNTDKSISVTAANHVINLDKTTWWELYSGGAGNAKQLNDMKSAFNINRFVRGVLHENIITMDESAPDPLVWGHIDGNKTKREVLQAALFAGGKYIHHCDGTEIAISPTPTSKASTPIHAFKLSAILDNTFKVTPSQARFGVTVEHQGYYNDAETNVTKTFTAEKAYKRGETISLGVPLAVTGWSNGAEIYRDTDVTSVVVGSLEETERFEYAEMSTKLYSSTVKMVGGTNIATISAPFAPLPDVPPDQQDWGMLQHAYELIKENNIVVDKLASTCYNYLQKAQYSATVVEIDDNGNPISPLVLGETYALYDTEKTTVSGILTRQKYSIEGNRIFKEIELHDF